MFQFLTYTAISITNSTFGRTISYLNIKLEKDQITKSHFIYTIVNFYLPTQESIFGSLQNKTEHIV
jgi:hypothetical protein